MVYSTDYSYCASLGCPLADKCKRHIQDPLADNTPLWKVHGKYDDETKTCELFDEK